MMLIGGLSERTGMFAGGMLFETVFTLSKFYMANAGRRFVLVFLNTLALDFGNFQFLCAPSQETPKVLVCFAHCTSLHGCQVSSDDIVCLLFPDLIAFQMIQLDNALWTPALNSLLDFVELPRGQYPSDHPRADPEGLRPPCTVYIPILVVPRICPLSILTMSTE